MRSVMTFSRSLAQKGKQEEGQQLEWDLGSNKVKFRVKFLNGRH